MLQVGQSGHAICRVPHTAAFVQVSLLYSPDNGMCFIFAASTSSHCHSAPESNFFVRIPSPREIEIFILKVTPSNNITRIYCQYNQIIPDPSNSTFEPQTAIIYVTEGTYT